VKLSHNRHLLDKTISFINTEGRGLHYFIKAIIATQPIALPLPRPYNWWYVDEKLMFKINYVYR